MAELYDLKIGDSVVAACEITEGGNLGRASAKFPEKEFIHANRGEEGKILSIEEEAAVVKFNRTGTITAVAWEEVERKVPFFNAPPLLDKYFELIGL